MGGLIPAPINLKQKGLKILESGTFDGASWHRNTQLKRDAKDFALTDFWLAEASKLESRSS